MALVVSLKSNITKVTRKKQNNIHVNCNTWTKLLYVVYLHNTGKNQLTGPL